MERPLRILGVADVRIGHTHKWANYFASRGHSDVLDRPGLEKAVCEAA